MSTLNDAMFVETLKRIADGIVAIVGPNCEVVMHDLSDPEHSVMYVAGNVTGRRSGAPVPDLSFISHELSSETPDQLNYKTMIGSRELQSSTIWIKDLSGDPIGAFCINIDNSELIHARTLIDRMLGMEQSKPELVVSNTFARDTNELIELSIEDFLQSENASSIESLSMNEKNRLIKLLEEKGLFQIRGAVKSVAELLQVSKATIYNYRTNVRAKTEAK